MAIEDLARNDDAATDRPFAGTSGRGSSAPSIPKRPTVGLVLEGGGYRGLYTAGVLDVWMEEGIAFDHVVGVSAGAAFGCNLKSCQIGRAVRYNKRFCGDPRYAGLGNLLRTGDLFSREFAYGEVPWRLDPFDGNAFAANPMRFTVVCTDVDTGRAEYRDLKAGDERDIEWIRASASIPALSRPVELDGHRYLDGGVADSIPVDWMLSQGHDRCVVVLTQPAGFRKEPNSLMPLLRMVLRRYPRVVAELADRHERYNTVLDEIARLEREGRVLVIRPSASVRTPIAVKDPAVLERVYQVGRADAEAGLMKLRAYLGQ